MQIHHWVAIVIAVLVGYYAHKFYPGLLPAS